MLLFCIRDTICVIFETGTFYLDKHILSSFITPPSLFPSSLGAVSGQTVACSDRQDSVVTTSAICAHNRNAERLGLHSSTAHTVLLHSGPLQGIHGLTAAFALTDRQTDGHMDSTTGREKGAVRNSVMISLNFVCLSLGGISIKHP